MEKFLDVTKAFWGNYLLISGVIGWFSAQIIKIFTNLFVKKKLDLRMFFANGGMPSSHSSTVVALSIAAAIQYGLGSSQFAISGIMAVIVMNDAFGVRWHAGQQAQMINKMIVELFSDKKEFDVKLKEIIGHTPFQVLMGAILGFIVAMVYAAILGKFPGAMI